MEMKQKGRILAIDWGTKKIGVAISDEMRIIATPLPTLEAKPVDALFSKIRKIVEAENVKTVLIGLPINIDGSMSVSSKMAREFGEKLRNLIQRKINIIYIDERLTTWEARLLLKQFGEKVKVKSGRLDQIAAATILQDYIDGKGNAKI